MTTTPPQPPQNPYPSQPPAEGYAPPPVQSGSHDHLGSKDQQYGQPQYGQSQPGQSQPGQFQPAQYGQPDGFPQYGPHDQQPQYADQPQFQQPGQQFAPAPQGEYQQPGQLPQDPTAQFPQDPAAQGQFMPVAHGTLQCRFCGGMPAVQATVRGHQGLIILMRFLKLEGPFCRTCGVATIRDMTAKSMWQGWWGIGSMIVNPIMMLVNLGTYSKFKNLPEPAPGAPGRPMDPGKPLFKRPVVLGLLLPIALIAVIVIGNLGSPSSAEAGDCVQNKGTVVDPKVKVVDCGSTDAEFKVLGKLSSTANSRECAKFPDYTVAYTESRGSSGYTLCLGPN